MRATIELPDDLHAAVQILAARKGYRGYSRVIAEALEFYLAEKVARKSGLQELLALRGTWSSEDLRRTRDGIEEVRANWNETTRRS